MSPDEQMALNLASPGVWMGQWVERAVYRMEQYADFPEERMGQEMVSPQLAEGAQTPLHQTGAGSPDWGGWAQGPGWEAGGLVQTVSGPVSESGPLRWRRRERG